MPSSSAFLPPSDSWDKAQWQEALCAELAYQLHFTFTIIILIDKVFISKFFLSALIPLARYL